MVNPQELHERRFAALLSLAIGCTMLLMKGGAYLLTGSSAILSDAMESVVHVAATSFALYSVIISAQPPDECHPYGHGKIEFFSSGFEGALIVVAAFSIIYEAAKGLIFGRPLQQLDTGILIITAAGVVNLGLGAWLVRTGRRTNSLTLEADGHHVLTDSFTSVGVVIGLILVRITGWTALDPLIAIAVALNIIFTGYRLMRVSWGGLMNEADQQSLQAMVDALNRQRPPVWIDVHHLRMWKSGERKVVDLHLTVPRYATVEDGHREEQAVAEVVIEAAGGPGDVLVHVDPCRDECCSFCAQEPCTIRVMPLAQRLPWTVDHAVSAPVYITDGDDDHEASAAAYRGT